MKGQAVVAMRAEVETSRREESGLNCFPCGRFVQTKDVYNLFWDALFSTDFIDDKAIATRFVQNESFNQCETPSQRKTKSL